LIESTYPQRANRQSVKSQKGIAEPPITFPGHCELPANSSIHKKKGFTVLKALMDELI
jgi:hypothetical protein